MRNSNSSRTLTSPRLAEFTFSALRVPRHFLLGVLLIFALLAFEAFNFDTTRYALENLLGDIRFAGIAWATILAVAFCAIDFAGLGRLFAFERGFERHKEIWYLTGAWLLGATMNAVMTWWAVSTVLLSHDLGNEVLSREQLLHIVPVFVAILVWLTRILFIGAVTLAGERLLHAEEAKSSSEVIGAQPRRYKQGDKHPSMATRPLGSTAIRAGTSEQGAMTSATVPRESGRTSPIKRRPLKPTRSDNRRPNPDSMYAASRLQR